MHLGCTSCSGRRREGALRAAARDARANGELEQAKRTVVHVEGTSVHGTQSFESPRHPLMHGATRIVVTPLQEVTCYLGYTSPPKKVRELAFITVPIGTCNQRFFHILSNSATY